jgi:hypothetical protein
LASAGTFRPPSSSLLHGSTTRLGGKSANQDHFAKQFADKVQTATLSTEICMREHAQKYHEYTRKTYAGQCYELTYRDNRDSTYW